MIQRYSVLITDDNPENLKVLSNILKDKGYEIRVAMTGEQAIDSVTAQAPDLILLDIQLPKMDGYEVCRRLRAHEEHKSIPIIFISAMSEAFNKVLAFEAGGDDYIQKPFQMEEVLARVKTHLQVREYQHQLEDANLVLLEQFKSTFEQAAVGIAHVALDSLRFIRINERFTQILGYSQDEILKKTVVEITHPDFRKSDQKDVQQLFKKQITTFTKEKIYIKKDSSHIWGRVTVSLVKHEHENISDYLVAVLEDISDRKKAEEELRKSRERYRNLVEHMDDLVYCVELSPNRCFTYVSPAAVKMTGYTPEDHYADPDLGYKLVHPDDRHILESLSNGEKDIRTPIVLRWIRKDGTALWTEQRNIPVYDDNGNLVAIEGIARDITAQKNAEEELSKQRALSARSDRLRSLGEMAAAISHELYQPLGGMRGRAEHLLLAQKRDWDVKPNTLKKNLTDIIESADRMNHIIEHVRLFAREAGKPESSPVNVNEVVQSTIKLVTEQFRSHGVTLKKQLSNAVRMISINPYSLEEVLLNLLTNARDAVEERMGADDAFDKPQVSIKTNLIESETDSMMQIVVSDNGIGISNEHMDKLFDPFFTTKGPDKGTGLGLSIVKSIVEQFRGIVTIKSNINKGTQVLIDFPIPE